MRRLHVLALLGLAVGGCSSSTDASSGEIADPVSDAAASTDVSAVTPLEAGSGSSEEAGPGLFLDAGSQPSTDGASTDGSSCQPGTVRAECSSDSQCDDGDPATTDTCQLTAQGEFPVGTCLHAGCDGGPSCAMQAVDPTCASDQSREVVYPPFVPLSAPDVPADCANGFELVDPTSRLIYVLRSRTPTGSRAIMLDVDFATYTAPDGLLITGIDGTCSQYTLFNSCVLKTADQPEGAYRKGKSLRPSDVAIRQFHAAVRAGTTELTLDFSRVGTPIYLRVLGLCDFEIFAPDPLPPAQFAAVP